MAKRYVSDCGAIMGSTCTVKIEGTRDEVLTVGTRHAVEDHGHPDDAETRRMVESSIKPMVMA